MNMLTVGLIKEVFTAMRNLKAKTEARRVKKGVITFTDTMAKSPG